MNKNNNAQFNEWRKILEKSIPEKYIKNYGGLINAGKLDWLSKYAYFHYLAEQQKAYAINESSNFLTLNNVIGMGPATTGTTLGAPPSFYTGQPGSGDKFPSLLSLSVNVAARTVGFDIVPVIPMPGPVGVLTYLDYVYAGGRINSSEKPLVFKIDVGIIGSSNYVVGNIYWGISGKPRNGYTGAAVKMIYVGRSRLDGYPIFRVVSTYVVGWDGTGNSPTYTLNDGISLSEVFHGTGASNDDKPRITLTDNDGLPDIDSYVITTNRAQYVQALVDHIAGFAGAGYNDNANWTGSYRNDNEVGGMGRGVGESTYPRTLSITAYTKFIEALSYKVSIGVTIEQLQDLKQFGLDTQSLMNNILQNELSQNINRHILDRAFALGWSNHYQAYVTSGANLNATFESSSTTISFNDKAGVSKQMPVPSITGTNGDGWINLQVKVLHKILGAKNLIQQLGRRGPANFVVTNSQIATIIQATRGFLMAPIANSIDQEEGNLYPLGTIAGMTVYVDPTMSWDDTRVLVGRKGANEEPGLKFMPYMMPSSVEIIAPGTFAPQIMAISRYALAEAGFYPETQYLTLYIKTTPGLV